MLLSTNQRRKFQERRHLFGGILLVGLLFGGHYLPEAVTLLIMVAVTWLAMISISGLQTAVVISSIGFVIPFGVFALRHWKGFKGDPVSLGVSLEVSLELAVLCSMVYGAVVWVKTILKSRQAGFEEVIGAFNLYIWIASIFACFYTLISKVDSNAFRIQDIFSKSDGIGFPVIRKNFEDLYYFSFVTQTTLGYGDIVPVSHIARALAVSQAIIGQFYVAVVLTYILNLWIRDLGRHVDHRIAPTADEKNR